MNNPYPLDPRFIVFTDGSVQGPRGKRTFGTCWNTGRLFVTTTMNGKKKSYAVHRMVLETFTGPAPIGCVASHLNGDCKDNRVDNLIWETQKNNCARKRIHGTAQSGEKNPAAKLTRKDVDNIKESLLSAKELAIHFGMNQKHIARIKRGTVWL